MDVIVCLHGMDAIACLHGMEVISCLHGMDVIAFLHNMDVIACLHGMEVIACLHGMNVIACLHVMDVIARLALDDDDDGIIGRISLDESLLGQAITKTFTPIFNVKLTNSPLSTIPYFLDYISKHMALKNHSTIIHSDYRDHGQASSSKV
ncbi:hypothetical protein Tco_1126568 [Tanacetum coccineum]